MDRVTACWTPRTTVDTTFGGGGLLIPWMLVALRKRWAASVLETTRSLAASMTSCWAVTVRGRAVRMWPSEARRSSAPRRVLGGDVAFPWAGVCFRLRARSRAP